MTAEEALKRSPTGIIWTRDGIPAYNLEERRFKWLDRNEDVVTGNFDWHPLPPSLREKESKTQITTTRTEGYVYADNERDWLKLSRELESKNKRIAELEAEVETRDKHIDALRSDVLDWKRIAEEEAENAELRKRIGHVRKQCDVASSEGNWNANSYMHGMANGLICALSSLDDKEPDYLAAPKQFLDERKPKLRWKSCEKQPPERDGLFVTLNRHRDFKGVFYFCNIRKRWELRNEGIAVALTSNHYYLDLSDYEIELPTE